MSENTTPDAIREAMASVYETCIERRIERREQSLANAAKFKERGNERQEEGDYVTAAHFHRHAIRMLEEAASDAVEILELCRDFGIEPPDELTGAGWAPVLTHSGVGEGDTSLPFAELPASDAGRIPVVLDAQPGESTSPSASAENPRPQGGLTYRGKHFLP